MFKTVVIARNKSWVVGQSNETGKQITRNISFFKLLKPDTVETNNLDQPDTVETNLLDQVIIEPRMEVNGQEIQLYRDDAEMTDDELDDSVDPKSSAIEPDDAGLNDGFDETNASMMNNLNLTNTKNKSIIQKFAKKYNLCSAPA